MFAEFLAQLREWLDQPFKQPVSALELFLGIGLVLLFLAAWGKIVNELKTEL